MKIYYIEYENTVKFFNKDKTLEIEKAGKLILFLKRVYKTYGKQIKFESLI